MRRFSSTRRAAPHHRSGFSLIEVMVAMTILAIVLMSLAKLSTVVAVRGRGNDVVAKRMAVLQMEANKFGAMRFDSLATFPTTTKSFTVSGFSYTRRLTITSPSSNRRTIKIVIVPATKPTATDSIIFDRTKPGAGALCSGC